MKGLILNCVWGKYLQECLVNWILWCGSITRWVVMCFENSDSLPKNVLQIIFHLQQHHRLNSLLFLLRILNVLCPFAERYWILKTKVINLLIYLCSALFGRWRKPIIYVRLHVQRPFTFNSALKIPSTFKSEGYNS